MRLDAIKLKNFRGYSHETCIKFSDLTTFIGRNDVGKSSVLEALEIFFNNDLICCEKDDLSIGIEGENIEISCVFSDFPTEVTIDATATTTLSGEYLLNSDGKLEIKKVFSPIARPKEKVYIVCNHPQNKGGDDLMELKITDLKKRVKEMEISEEEYDARVNSSMRRAIWASFGDDLHLGKTELAVDKEDCKKVYESLRNYLPFYALFQSDRQSKDDDKEVSDPMKIAVQQALHGLNSELEHISNVVRDEATRMAQRTLDKLKEMSPDIAQELSTEFKSDPKFDSQFKLSIKSENGISINKRGSGVRRLILLNFFRAEAERRRTEQSRHSVIYAFEEPETSQHPDFQKMLINSFIELSKDINTQIILTTHSPALGELVPLEGLRFIKKEEGRNVIEENTEETYKDIAETLGVIQDIDRGARAILLVEGQSDVVFITHVASVLKTGEYISDTLADKHIAIIPIGCCGNLKSWVTMGLANQFGIPYCVFLDSDREVAEAVTENTKRIDNLRNNHIVAFCTRKRELENYLHPSVISENCPEYSDYDDVKIIANGITNIAKNAVLERLCPRMTADLIRQMDQYEENGETKHEFIEVINAFTSLVE